MLMEGWLSWLKAPDSKSGARFIRAAGSNPAPSASFSQKARNRPAEGKAYYSLTATI